MIRLEELKEGDKVYQICEYYWFQEVIVLGHIQFNNLNYVKAEALSQNEFNPFRKSLFYLSDVDTINLFRTKEETLLNMKKHRSDQKEQWKDKDKLIKHLFNKSNLPNAEMDLINEILDERKKEFCNFYEAWQYLNNHSIFKDENGSSRFQDCLDMKTVKINPQTNEIDNNKELNIKVQIWLECGKYNKGIRWHEIDLDCGGNSFEEAIIELANLVKKRSRKI